MTLINETANTFLHRQYDVVTYSRKGFEGRSAEMRKFADYADLEKEIYALIQLSCRPWPNITCIALSPTSGEHFLCDGGCSRQIYHHGVSLLHDCTLQKKLCPFSCENGRRGGGNGSNRIQFQCEDSILCLWVGRIIQEGILGPIITYTTLQIKFYTIEI